MPASSQARVLHLTVIYDRRCKGKDSFRKSKGNKKKVIGKFVYNIFIIYLCGVKR